MEMKKPSSWQTWLLPSVVDIIFIRMFVNIIRRPISSLDIWWHLKTGEIIVSNLSVPHTNLFSFTAQNAVWVTHEWLSQLIFYLVYNWFGGNGLAVLRAVIFSVMLVIIYKTITANENHFLLAVVLIILGSQLLVPAATLRPWLFSNFLAALLVFIFSGVRKPRKYFWLMPLILWAWSNFHGSYVIGYLIAFLKCCDLFIDGKKDEGKSFIKWYAIAITLLFVNPNGLALLTYPLKYRLGSLFFAYITEWQQPNFHSFFGLLFEFYIALLFIAFLFSGRTHKFIGILTTLIFVHLAFTAKRNTPYLVIVTLPLLAEHLSKSLSSLKELINSRFLSLSFFPEKLWKLFLIELNRLSFLDKHFRKHTYALVFFFGALLFFSVSVKEAPDVAYNFKTSIAPIFPVKAVEFYQKEHFHGKMLNYFNWGGYLIWKLYPETKVFIDGRADPYPTQVLNDYYAIHHLQRWKSILKKYKIQWVLYPKDEPLSKLLKESPDWKLIYQDKTAMLFKNIIKTIK